MTPADTQKLKLYEPNIIRSMQKLTQTNTLTHTQAHRQTDTSTQTDQSAISLPCLVDPAPKPAILIRVRSSFCCCCNSYLATSTNHFQPLSSPEQSRPVRSCIYEIGWACKSGGSLFSVWSVHQFIVSSNFEVTLMFHSFKMFIFFPA